MLMRKVIFGINVSLDGCADHTVAFADDELHEFFVRQFDELDTVLFGRKTYELFADFWPTAPEDPRITPGMIKYAHGINAIQKIVFSKTMPAPDWNNTTVDRTDATTAVAILKRQTGKSLSVGGLSLARSLMNARLIDEYFVLIHPVVWGAGPRFFDGIRERMNLRLVETRTFQSGVVVLHYIDEIACQG
jgi:dihydrofolate reductase